MRQTDVHSELLILNDHHAQELVFDHPRVRVVNEVERFPTLGEKYNALVSLAAGSLLAPWEDDDISLPHRLELSRARLGDRDYYNPRRYWFLDRDGLHWDHSIGVGHNLSLFRKRAWHDVGGYPVVTGSQDAAMDNLLTGHPRVRCRVEEEPLPLPEWYYIYRWGVSPCHLSGEPDMQGFYDVDRRRPSHGRAVHSSATLACRLRVPLAAAAQRDGVPRSRHDGTRGRIRRTGAAAAGRLRHHLQAGRRLPGRRRPIEDWGSAALLTFSDLLPRAAIAASTATCRPPRCRRHRPGRLHLDRPTASSCGTCSSTTCRWQGILRNALASFRRRMVLVVHTPFVRATSVAQSRCRHGRRRLRSRDPFLPWRPGARVPRGRFPNRRECPDGLRLWAGAHLLLVQGWSGMTGVHPELAAAYRRACATVSDIYQHLPSLCRYASCCRHVTEFGTRTGVSTLAFLRALPERLVAYDLYRLPEVDRLEELARLQNIDFLFRLEDTRHAEIEPTDLLFIDTDHTRSQLEAELAAAAAKVRRYLIFHDTETFGEEGRDGGDGLWPAIAAFVRDNPAWCLLDHDPANNGLTVLWRSP